jgi:Protein of unknown function (DUF1592)/Protein of unknown function (DUF1588)/Protein of unknown function (DUF1595)/Protein of unknown function (DUF1585)
MTALRRPPFKHLTLVFPAVLVAACSGAIGGDKGPVTGGTVGGTGSSGPSGIPCVASPPPAQRLYLLDTQRYVNTVSDLLGSDAVSDMDRRNARRANVFADGVPTLSDATVAERVAEAAARTLVGAKLDAFVGCTGAAQTDACARTALAALMQKAFRRPVATDEVDALMTTAYLSGRTTSFARGIQVAVEAVLMAGSTLYLKELGTPASNGLLALDPFEVASQISYFLLDSLPDGELYNAAATGALRQPAEVEKQVARLLRLPAVQQTLTNLVVSQYHLDDVLTATAVDGSLRDVYTDSLRASFFEETQRVVGDVLWKTPRSYLDLFRGEQTFVNRELASKIYGVPFPATGDEWIALTVPASRPSAGLFTHGSLLAGKAKANTGSVVKRGKSLRVNFLCLSSPSPPDLANPDIKASLEAQQQSTRTEADLAGERAANAVCKSCHSFFDPLGLALNQFDRAGRFVATEPAPRAALDGVDPRWQGQTVSGPIELGQHLSQHPGLAACVTSNVLRFAARDANDVEGCAVAKARDAFATSEFRFDTLVKATTTSELFLARRAGGMP